MTRLSVNINKVALLRNSRRGNYPDLFKFAVDCERFGAQGITIHPRPDQRHIRYTDVPVLAGLVQTELNIEGYPSEDLLKLVLDNKPVQCTLVPDGEHVLTSEEGWDVKGNMDFLARVCDMLKKEGIRVSVFINPEPEQAVAAAAVGADCIELYTGTFSHDFANGCQDESVLSHIKTAMTAMEHGLMVNAGHDLNLDNLAYYKSKLPGLDEVSIGHAIIADSIYFGIENAIKMYLQKLL